MGAVKQKNIHNSVKRRLIPTRGNTRTLITSDDRRVSIKEGDLARVMSRVLNGGGISEANLQRLIGLSNHSEASAATIMKATVRTEMAKKGVMTKEQRPGHVQAACIVAKESFVSSIVEELNAKVEIGINRKFKGVVVMSSTMGYADWIQTAALRNRVDITTLNPIMQVVLDVINV